ncbi:MAG: tetratricopeptide repeat protein [Candidatus Moraniibacteriota bacterium]
MRAFWQKKKIYFILIIVGIIIYSNALTNQLFWDDNDGIVNNAYIKDWQYLPNYFSENLIAGAGLSSNYWRPILLITYAIEWEIWGLWPAGYHLVSILVHIFACLLIFKLFNLLTKKRWLAFFSALLFLVHPLQTEAVTYVSGLADPLSTAFTVLGLIYYLKRGKENILWPVWFFFILALMTKEKALLIFPALLFILELTVFLHENPKTINFIQWKEWFFLKAKSLWPIFAIGIFYVLLRATSLNFQNTFNLYDGANVYADSILVRTWTFLKIFPNYLKLIFWPFELHMERLVQIETSFFSSLVFLGLIFLALLFFRALSQAKKNPFIFFALGWFLSSLLSSSGIPAVSSGIMYEHYLYLPLAGFFLWLGLELENLTNYLKKTVLVKQIIFILVLAIAFFFSVLTIQRNRVWKTPITLYENILDYNQTSLRVWNNLGMAYADTKQMDNAVNAYQKATELDPQKVSAPPYHNLANAFSALGKKDEAIANYKEALRINPDFTFSYGALFNLYIEEKRYDEAIAFFEDLSQKSPRNKSGINEILNMLKKVKAGAM